MGTIVLVLTSGPGSAAATGALELADALSRQGHALTVCCLQDAAILASDHAPREARAALDRLLDRGARCVVRADDLALRGLSCGARASTTDAAGLIAILTGSAERILGCF